MNPISRAIFEARNQIPDEILQALFNDRGKHFRATPDTITEHLKALVIRPRVLIDCDIVGGTEILIRLEGLMTSRPDDFTSIYRIPKTMTQNRSILSVLNVTFNDPTGVAYYGMATGCQSTQMMATAQGLLDAAGTIPVTSTSQVQLIGENVVSVRDTTILPANAYLRCMLASDENMSHLQLRTFRQFSHLCVLAIKAYIYNKLAIRTDLAELSGGFQLGRFREFVDSYSDAEELYQTYLREVWQKVSLMNDAEKWTRTLRSVIGGHR